MAKRKIRPLPLIVIIAITLLMFFTVLSEIPYTLTSLEPAHFSNSSAL